VAGGGWIRAGAAGDYQLSPRTQAHRPGPVVAGSALSSARHHLDVVDLRVDLISENIDLDVRVDEVEEPAS
jgi:hypothetical protein